MFKIFKDLYIGCVCVLGWTPQTIWTIFFCKTYNRCSWIEAAVPQTWIPYEIWGSISALYNLNNVSDSNDFRAFMIIPIPLAIVRDMHLICSIQFNLLSTIIPKNFALSTSWILAPHIWIVGQTSFYLSVCISWNLFSWCWYLFMTNKTINRLFCFLYES